FLESRSVENWADIPGIQDSRLGSITYADPEICDDFNDEDDDINLDDNVDTNLSDNGSSFEPIVIPSPNPFDQILSVRLSATFGVEGDISLLDANGKLVRHLPITTGNTRIDTNELPRGIYYLRVSNATQTLVKKLVKQ
ncbi:MAG: T9SS type A sorting domain-containing protein, partial [Bacteroidota bacterium]